MVEDFCQAEQDLQPTTNNQEAARQMWYNVSLFTSWWLVCEGLIWNDTRATVWHATWYDIHWSLHKTHIFIQNVKYYYDKRIQYCGINKGRLWRESFSVSQFSTSTKMLRINTAVSKNAFCEARQTKMNLCSKQFFWDSTTASRIQTARPWLFNGTRKMTLST